MNFLSPQIFVQSFIFKIHFLDSAQMYSRLNCDHILDHISFNIHPIFKNDIDPSLRKYDVTFCHLRFLFGALFQNSFSRLSSDLVPTQFCDHISDHISLWELDRTILAPSSSSPYAPSCWWGLSSLLMVAKYTQHNIVSSLLYKPSTRTILRSICTTPSEIHSTNILDQ